MFRIIPIFIHFYDWLQKLWENHRTHHQISRILVTAFLAGILIAELAQRGLLPAYLPIDPNINHFFAIELAFTLLLLAELLALIFALPESVAVAVGKQFEILSLILLRSAFKEFKNFEEPIVWTSQNEAVFKMMADAGGSLVIFFLLGIYYHVRKRIAISESEIEHQEFQGYKKIVALFLLGTFLLIGGRDIWSLFSNGMYPSSFNTFYTVLIFTDIFLVLVALRYTMDYYKIFRYSAFVVATVLIRISLSAPAISNAILGIVATAFLICTTLAYNFFFSNYRKPELQYK